MLWYKDPTCTTFRPEKTSEIWPRIETYLTKYGTIKNLEYNLQTRNVQFKDHKKLKTYFIVRTEPSLNENSRIKRPQI